MVLTRSKSTVLGKRTLAEDSLNTDPLPNSSNEDGSGKKSKRTRTVEENFDPRANKENIPPDTTINNTINTDPSIRTPTLRRTATDASIGSSRNVRSLPRRTASTSAVNTPTRSSSTRDVITAKAVPTPPKALQPIHIRVRSALRPTCDSPSNALSGRAEERAVLDTFIAAFLAGRAASLYVSGTPGTGKTALVHEVVRGVAGDDVQVVYLNCMALKDIAGMYDRLLEELSHVSTKGKKALKGKAAVECLLEGLDKRCVLILDELDHLTTTTTSLTTIFSLARSPTLCIIGIANTHTLTASLPSQDQEQVQTLHFKAYTPPELQAIITTRLAPLQSESPEAVKKLLPPPALMFLSKKVASYTGDVRLLFEVLRGAIDRAVTAANALQDDDPLNTPAPVVTPTHVLAALKASSSSSSSPAAMTSAAGGSVMEMKVRELNLKPQLVLLAIILAFKRVEAGLSLAPSSSSSSKSSSSKSPSPSTESSIDVPTLHTYLSSILSTGGTGFSEFIDILGLLEGVGLVLLSSTGSGGTPGTPSKRRKTLGRTSSMSSGVMGRTQEVCVAEGVRVEEVLRGLGIEESASSSPASPAASPSASSPASASASDADLSPSSPAEAEVDVKKDELRTVWRAEGVRLAREVRARASAASKSRVESGEAFEGARRGC